MSENQEFPTIEELMEREKNFATCFTEARGPVLLWLNELRIENDPSRPSSLNTVKHNDFKSYIQSQTLPMTFELRSTHPDLWFDLCTQKSNDFRRRIAQSRSPELEEQAGKAVEERRVMAGKIQPRNADEASLPRYTVPGSQYRNFAVGTSHREPNTFRINIPDHPGEDTEVILNGIIRKFWAHPLFRENGFGAKTLGSQRTDALILYVGDSTVDEAIRIITEDAEERLYGSVSKPARFAQVVDEAHGGITINTNPKRTSGLNTFGSLISDLLEPSLRQFLEQSNMPPEELMQQLLESPDLAWATNALGPIFEARAHEELGDKLNMHNLAFIDKAR